MTPDIARLKDAIRRLHGCESEHSESLPVTETFQGQTVWQGQVEAFTMIGHPQAKRCYAWSYRNDDGSDQFVAVLELTPVCSAITAVRAAIVADQKFSQSWRHDIASNAARRVTGYE